MWESKLAYVNRQSPSHIPIHDLKTVLTGITMVIMDACSFPGQTGNGYATRKPKSKEFSLRGMIIALQSRITSLIKAIAGRITMLRRLILLLIIMIVIFGCAKKNTEWKETHSLNLVGTVPLVGNPIDMDAGENTLYVAEDNGGLSIVNLTDMTKKWHTFVYNPPPNTMNLVRVRKLSVLESQNKLFINEVGATDLIRILDISDTDTLLAVADITGGTSAILDMKFNEIINPQDSFTMEGLFCNGNSFKIGKYDGDANMWFGITQEITTPAVANGFFATSGLIYIAAQQRGLVIYDRATGAKISEIDLPGEAQKVTVVGNYAYLPCRQAGLQIVDVTNPASPVIRGSFDTTGYATTVDIWGNYALVSSGAGGVYLLDIANPENPLLRDNLTACGYTNLAKFHAGKIIVAARDNGIMIYEIAAR